jgi:hypothetical protein
LGDGERGRVSLYNNDAWMFIITIVKYTLFLCVVSRLVGIWEENKDGIYILVSASSILKPTFGIPEELFFRACSIATATRMPEYSDL